MIDGGSGEANKSLTVSVSQLNNKLCVIMIKTMRGKTGENIEKRGETRKRRQLITRIYKQIVQTRIKTNTNCTYLIVIII